MYGYVHLRIYSFQPTEERLGIYSFDFFWLMYAILLDAGVYLLLRDVIRYRLHTLLLKGFGLDKL